MSSLCSKIQTSWTVSWIAEDPCLRLSVLSDRSCMMIGFFTSIHFFFKIIWKTMWSYMTFNSIHSSHNRRLTDKLLSQWSSFTSVYPGWIIISNGQWWSIAHRLRKWNWLHHEIFKTSLVQNVDFLLISEEVKLVRKIWKYYQ